MATTTINGTGGNDTLPGTGDDDSISGLGGNDVLDGQGGNDTLLGGDGNDQLHPGFGNNYLDGGNGFDWAYYHLATDPVLVNLGTGSATGDGTDTLVGIEGVFGSAYNDTLTGSSGGDYFEGGGGDDSLSGLGGNDAVGYSQAAAAVTVNLQAGIATGGAGNDTLSGFETVFGSAFNDTITGSSAGEYIEGLLGNDTLDGAGGSDTVSYFNAAAGVNVNLTTGLASGGAGNDVLVNFEYAIGSNFADTVIGDAGANGILGYAGADSLVGEDGDDSLVGDSGDDTILAGAGQDQVTGGLGNDILDGGTHDPDRGSDWVIYAAALGSVTVNLALGQASGADGNDILSNFERVMGSAFADTIIGNSGDNILRGNGGNDSIDGGGGFDAADYSAALGSVTVNLANSTSSGADGTDTLAGMEAVRGSNFADSLFGDGNNNALRGNGGDDTLNGSGGNDTAEYFNATSAVTVNLALQVATGGDGNDTLISIENAQGSDGFGDSLIGDNGANRLDGRGGSDSIFGGAGQDTLIGRSGNDTLDGGVILDRINYTDLNFVFYSAAKTGVVVNLSGITGDGSSGSGTASDGEGGADVLMNVNFVLGSAFDDVITGSSAAIFEQFEGGLGNDTINGGTIDAITLSNSNRVTYQNASSAVTVDLAAGTASGGDGNDTLININHVRGSNSGDTLLGSGSTLTEQFEGRAGNDTIDGKGGTDLVRYDAATIGVNVNLVTGQAQDGQGGFDVLLNIEGIRGSNFNDVLTGGNAANGIGTTDGFEFFLGNAGNDTIDGGAGFDRVDYITSTSGVVVTLGGAVAGTANDGLGGVDSLIGIEAVRGSDFGDVLTGSDTGTFESFEGRAGIDTIDGKGGTDRIDYTSSTSAASVNLATGTASDGWGSSDSLTNIEDARGSVFNDTLVGNSGSNRLEGGAGSDTLTGAGASDTFVLSAGSSDTVTDFQVGTGGDVLAFSGVLTNYAGGNPFTDGHFMLVQSGADTLVKVDVDGNAGPGAFETIGTLLNVNATSITGANINNGWNPAGGGGFNGTAGTDILQGTGSNDTLMGQDGNDYLDGAGGNDSMSGGAGDDTLVAGPGNDTFQGDDGTDTLVYLDSPTGVVVTKPQTASMGVMGTASDGFGGTDVIGHGTADILIGSDFNDVLTGSPIYTAFWGEVFGDDYILGGSGDDSIVGLGGEDLLYGDTGNDTLLGGAGDDILIGGLGNDTLDGSSGFDVAFFDDAGAVNVNLKTGVATGGAGTDVLLHIEAVGGSSFNDTLTGGDGDDFIGGMEGNDLLNGGAGFDVLYYGDAAGGVSVNLATGAVSGADGVDIISNFEGIEGSESADNLVGNNVANRLEGFGGADSLRGGGGNDTLDGWDGFDTAYFSGNRSNYTIVVDPTTGNQTVTDLVADRDGTDVLTSIEHLQFADQAVGATFIQIDPEGTYLTTSIDDPANTATKVVLADIGIAAGDVITLTRFGDYQAGLVLQDTSNGLSAVFWNGTSFISAEVFVPFGSLRQASTQTSTDITHDFFVGGGGIVQVKVPAGATALYFSPNDGYFSDNSDPDGDFSVLIQKLNGTTSFSGSDVLAGTTGSDTLLAGAGRDSLLGGPGNDVLDGGAITDRVNYSDLNVLIYITSPPGVSGAGVNINLAGITGDGGTGSGTVSDGFGGTDTVSNVNFITGSAFNDTITGSSARIFEEFTGAGGNDTIDGGAIDPITQNNSNRVNYAPATGAVTVNFTNGTASGDGVGTDALTNINHVRGSNFNDTLTGSDSTLTEQFEGAGGNDSIDGKGGTDMVRYDSATAAVQVSLITGIAQDGLGGTDSLANIEGIRGSAFGDTLTGGHTANGTGTTDGFEFFIGNAGNDTIDGGGGYDRVDYNTSTAGAIVILGGTGQGTASDGLGGVDTLINIEALRGSEFGDVLIGSDSGAFESVEGRAGNDTIDGKGGTDRIDFSSSTSAASVNLGTFSATDGWGGTDILLHIENIRGTSFSDLLVGDQGDNSIEGAAGNDTLQGSDGADSLTGGAGNDVLNGGANDPLLGYDWAIYTAAAGAVNVNLGTGLASGADGNDTLTGIEGIMGSASNDVLVGDAGTNVLRGNLGTDTIDGAGGDDWIDYGAASGSVTVNLATGVVSGADGSDVIAQIERIRGSNFNDTLTGDAGDNRLRGNRGDDVLDGGSGTDGADYYNANGAVSVDLQAGISSGADGNDTLSGIENILGSFNHGDTLTGDNGANLLDGRGGDDVIDGHGGDDTLVGGAGDDTLDGGSGTDTATFSGNFDDYTITPDSEAGGLIVSGPDGTDLLRSIERLQFADRTFVYFSLAEGEHELDRSGSDDPEVISGLGGDDTLLAGTSDDGVYGGGGDDSLVAGLGADTLDGGTGNDTLVGGDGGDVYVVDSEGDLVVETSNPLAFGPGIRVAASVGSSIDRVVASINYTLGSFVEDLTLAAGAGLLTGTGNELGNILTGNADSNVLAGLAGNDTLLGEGGNDSLDGGAGNDSVDGGEGTDTAVFAGARSSYVVQWQAGTGNVLVQSATEGTDTLVSVEVLKFSDMTLAVNITNIPGSVVQGTTGHDVLQGTLGNDTVNGLVGTDILLADLLPSQYLYSGGVLTGPEGSDTLNSVEAVRFGAGFGAATTSDLPLASLTDPDGNGPLTSAAKSLLLQIADLYVAYFNRAPDVPGILYWFRNVNSGEWQIDQVASSFTDQVEYQLAYPPGTSNTEFVARIYDNLLDRVPDQAGWDYWVNDLNNGSPRDIFILTVIRAVYSPTGGAEDKLLMNNKHDVCLYYTEQLALNPGELFDPNIDMVLNRVSDDLATVEQGKAVVDFLMDSEVTLTGLSSDVAQWDGFWS